MASALAQSRLPDSVPRVSGASALSQLRFRPTASVVTGGSSVLLLNRPAQSPASGEGRAVNPRLNDHNLPVVPQVRATTRNFRQRGTSEPEAEPLKRGARAPGLIKLEMQVPAQSREEEGDNRAFRPQLRTGLLYRSGPGCGLMFSLGCG